MAGLYGPSLDRRPLQETHREAVLAAAYLGIKLAVAAEHHAQQPAWGVFSHAVLIHPVDGGPVDRLGAFTNQPQDLDKWTACIRPVCDAVSELLWLIRESGEPRDKLAINGMYQHNMQKDSNTRLLRVSLDGDHSLFPEISGSQHRFTVRFLEWSSVNSRAVQTGHDVSFQLSIC